jgi:hypothetical protein
MRERRLQSLAILLAGLFSAERFRSSGVSSQLFPQSNAPEPPTHDAAARPKANEN